MFRVSHSPDTNPKEDISTLLGRGHFYFALTLSLFMLDKTVQQTLKSS